MADLPGLARVTLQNSSAATLEPPRAPLVGGVAYCRSCSPNLLPRERCSTWPADKDLDDLTDDEVMGVCPYDAAEEMRRRQTCRADTPSGLGRRAQDGPRGAGEGFRSHWPWRRRR